MASSASAIHDHAWYTLSADVLVRRPLPDRLGIDHDDDGVEGETRAMAIGRDRGRVGHAAGLDDQPLRTGVERGDGRQRGGQAVDQAAADAAVGQGNRVAVVPLDQVAVDVDVAEVVDQDGDPLAPRSEHVVDEGGLPGTGRTAYPNGRMPARAIQHRKQSLPWKVVTETRPVELGEQCPHSFQAYFAGE